MKTPLRWIAGLAMGSVLIATGCGPTDVTTETRYDFASFSGTVWKTKVTLAVGELWGTTYLLSPRLFDPSTPGYVHKEGLHILYTVPPGSEVRIERLMKDNGEWGGVWVTVTVTDRTHPPRVVQVDDVLLANNVFISRGPTTDETWGVNSDLLERP